MASTTRNLRLRLTPGLTVDAVYNLERIDAAVGNQLYTNASGLTLLRAERDIAIEPNSADVGGTGVGGLLWVGTSTHMLGGLIVNAATVDIAGDFRLRNVGGALYTSIQSTPTSDTNATLRLQLTSGSHTLALAGNAVLGGSFTTGEHALSLNLTGPTSILLPTSGTLATLAGVETLSNKTLTSPIITNASLTTVGLTNATITSSSIDSSVIGGTVPAAGSFTSLNATSMAVDGDPVITVLGTQVVSNKTIINSVISGVNNTLTDIAYSSLVLTGSITGSDIASSAKRDIAGVAGRTVVTGGAGAALEDVEVDIDLALLPTPETAHVGHVLQAVAEGVATWAPIDVADEKVKASASDSAAGYLTDKITASSGAAVSLVGNSSLNITNTDKGSSAVASHESAYAHGEIALNSAARHSPVSIGTANGLSLVGQVLSMGTASLSSAGALSASDWSAFNAKQDALVIGSIAGVAGRTSIIGGTNAIIGSGVSIDIATSLLPSPLEADAGKVLTASGANTAVWVTPPAAIEISVVAPLTSDGEPSPILGITQASATTDGYVSDTDWNIFNDKMSYASTGCITTPTYHSNGGGSLTVDALDVVLYDNATFDGKAERYSLSAITATLSDQVMNYVIGDYNNGTPIMRVVTDVNLITESSIIPILSVFRDGEWLEIQNWDAMAKGLVNKLHQSIVKTDRYRHASGLALSAYGTRNVECSAGVVWVGATRYNLDTVASATDNIIYFERTGGAWVMSNVTTYNNTSYSDGVNTQTLTNNRYAVNWLYRGVEDYKHLYMVLGTGDYSLTHAQASQPPANLPPKISSHGMLVGRIIVEKNASVATQIDSAFAVHFTPSVASIHNDLAGLQGGTSGEYYHLTAAQKDTLDNQSAATLEPTGFTLPSEVVVTYNSSARTVTLTHPSGTIDCWYRGTRLALASPWTSLPHDTSYGSYFLSLDSSGATVWSNSFPGFSNGIYAAYVYYTAATKFGIRECHGLLQWQAWKAAHETVGTYRTSGGALTAGTWSLNTNSVAAVTPGVDSALIHDEDLPTTVAALPDGGPYTTLHFINSQAVFTTSATFPYVNDGTEIQYNPGGISLATVGTNNRWINVYAILVPTCSDSESQQYRVVWLQGQTLHTTLASAQAEDFRTLNTGNLTSVFSEFVPYARLTLRRASSYTNTRFAQIDAAPTYVVGTRSSLISITGFTPSDHNALSNLQGGASGDYQHLTSAELLDVQNLGTISSKNLTISTSLPSGSASEGDLWVVI